ncbi:MAG: DEAD/DEAH box helicase [Thermoanaerobaculia bacterium]
MSFTTFRLEPTLQRGIADLGFTDPTPIQRDAIPPALEGRDLLACAMTGSGKTAAFALPILQRLAAAKRGATRALVLAPTRELAAQIVEHFAELGKHTPVRAAAVFGGVGMEPQERALRRGTDVIVACPGRLLDHMQSSWARMPQLEVLVLDEADRMLDMGFLPDIRRILALIPKPQQTLFFSATLPHEIRELARQLLKNPVTLNIERPAAPATGVSQAIFPVRQDLKPALLLEMLTRKAIGNALVFTRTKHRADRLWKFLDKNGVPCDRIHGNRSQAQRTQALGAFKAGKLRVLLATDVAARGIDIAELSHVVNFDVPGEPDAYIHRVGRTARAGATGEAFTFVAPEEQADLRAIERAVAKTIPRRLIEGFDYEKRAAEKFEIPIEQRIAEIRARKAEDRARAKAKAERKAGLAPRGAEPRTQARPGAPSGRSHGPSSPRPATHGAHASHAGQSPGAAAERPRRSLRGHSPAAPARNRWR